MGKITHQDLKDYRSLKLELDNLEESILKLDRKITSAKTQLPKRDGAGKKRTLEDNIHQINKLKDKHVTKFAELMQKIFDIEEFIDTLEDPTARMIFRLRYVEGLEWEKICVKVHYRWRKVHTVHRGILDEMNKEQPNKINKEHPVHTIS